MNVKQLIEKLQKADPNAEVVHWDEYSEVSTPLVEMKIVNRKDWGDVVNQFVLTWHPDYVR